MTKANVFYDGHNNQREPSGRNYKAEIALWLKMAMSGEIINAKDWSDAEKLVEAKDVEYKAKEAEYKKAKESVGKDNPRLKLQADIAKAELASAEVFKAALFAKMGNGCIDRDVAYNVASEIFTEFLRDFAKDILIIKGDKKDTTAVVCEHLLKDIPVEVVRVSLSHNSLRGFLGELLKSDKVRDAVASYPGVLQSMVNTISGHKLTNKGISGRDKEGEYKRLHEQMHKLNPGQEIIDDALPINRRSSSKVPSSSSSAAHNLEDVLVQEEIDAAEGLLDPSPAVLPALKKLKTTRRHTVSGGEDGKKLLRKLRYSESAAKEVIEGGNATTEQISSIFKEYLVELFKFSSNTNSTGVLKKINGDPSIVSRALEKALEKYNKWPIEVDNRSKMLDFAKTQFVETICNSGKGLVIMSIRRSLFRDMESERRKVPRCVTDNEFKTLLIQYRAASIREGKMPAAAAINQRGSVAAPLQQQRSSSSFAPKSREESESPPLDVNDFDWGFDEFRQPPPSHVSQVRRPQPWYSLPHQQQRYSDGDAGAAPLQQHGGRIFSDLVQERRLVSPNTYYSPGAGSTEPPRQFIWNTTPKEQGTGGAGEDGNSRQSTGKHASQYKRSSSSSSNRGFDPGSNS